MIPLPLYDFAPKICVNVPENMIGGPSPSALPHSGKGRKRACYNAIGQCLGRRPPGRTLHPQWLSRPLVTFQRTGSKTAGKRRDSREFTFSTLRAQNPSAAGELQDDLPSCGFAPGGQVCGSMTINTEYCARRASGDQNPCARWA
jgi:hypothetical protein